jgi:hypothetical protein
MSPPGSRHVLVIESLTIAPVDMVAGDHRALVAFPPDFVEEPSFNKKRVRSCLPQRSRSLGEEAY